MGLAEARLAADGAFAKALTDPSRAVGALAAAAAAAITAGPIGAEREPEEMCAAVEEAFSLFFLRKKRDERSFLRRRFPRPSSSSKFGLYRKSQK